jgi:peroxiredoxin
MRRRQAVAAALAVTAGGAALMPRSAAAAPAKPGDAVAWPEVGLLDGARWSAADAEGKAVVVVFWSVTCPYCQRHNARLEKLRQLAAGRALAILGVARDRDAEPVLRKMAQQGWQFPVTLEASAMAEALSARRLVPLTATVDRRGRLLQVIPGEMSEEDMLELLRLAA